MKSDKNAKQGEKMPLNVEKAYRYHVRGFTAKETAKMLDIAERTVQRWAKDYDFKENATPKAFDETILALSQKGFSYSEIALKMKCCKTTVYNKIKKLRVLKNGS